MSIAATSPLLPSPKLRWITPAGSNPAVLGREPDLLEVEDPLVPPPEEDLVDHPARPVRDLGVLEHAHAAEAAAVLLEEAVSAVEVALDIATQVGRAEAEVAARLQDPPDVREPADHLLELEMLDEVLGVRPVE